jgi:hypothetical protein
MLDITLVMITRPSLAVPHRAAIDSALTPDRAANCLPLTVPEIRHLLVTLMGLPQSELCAVLGGSGCSCLQQSDKQFLTDTEPRKP